MIFMSLGSTPSARNCCRLDEPALRDVNTSVKPSSVSSAQLGPSLKKRKPPWVGPVSSYWPLDKAVTRALTGNGAPWRSSVLPPTAASMWPPTPAASHRRTTAGSHTACSTPLTPRRRAACRISVESPGLPPPTLSPTSNNTTGPSGAALARSKASSIGVPPWLSAARISQAAAASRCATCSASAWSLSVTAMKDMPISGTSA